MRHPTIHIFLKWAGPSILGGIATILLVIAGLAQVWSGVKQWAESWYFRWEPVMTAGWFVILMSCLILGYLAALVWTGGARKTKQSQSGAWLTGGGLENLKVSLAESTKLETRFFPLGSEKPQSALGRLINGSWEDAAEKVLKDREAEEQVARQRLIREARHGEIKDRRIPFVAVRQIAAAKGVDLPSFGPAQNNAYYLEGALRQAAVDDTLKVWGRKYRGPVNDNDPLVPIPPSHFEEYSFRHGVLGYQEPNENSSTATIRMLALGARGIEQVTYYDLHLSETDAERVVSEFAESDKNEKE